MVAPSAHVIEQFGALHHDALAGIDAGGDQDALAVERLGAHRPRLEALGADVLEDEILSVGGAHHRAARHRDAVACRRRSRANTVTNWPARRPSAPLSTEKCTGIDWLRSAKPEPRKASASDVPLPVLAEARLRLRAAASKLSASIQSCSGIDDLEDDRIALRDLAGDRRAVGDDAGDRRDQRLRLAADLVERGAAVLQALQVRAGFPRAACARPRRSAPAIRSARSRRCTIEICWSSSPWRWRMSETSIACIGGVT